MGVFKKILSSVGIGSAKVDTVLSQSNVRIGENIEGFVRIKGGDVNQTIDKVELKLKTEYIKESNDVKERRTATLVKVIVARDIVVGPNDRKQIPFSFKVPDHTPISIKKKSVWLETELNIALAIDPEDRDYVEIKPSSIMQVILDAVMVNLGFSLREVECEAGYISESKGGFIQEFEFVPRSLFKGDLDELEITFLPDPNGVSLFMQVDRKVKGLKSLFQEAAGLDEKYIRVTITNYDASKGSSYIANMLKNIIEEYC